MSAPSSRASPESASANANVPPDRRKATLLEWVIVAGAILGAFMAVLDISIVNSALPNIQGALSATLEEGSWISTSYLIMEIIVIPLSGLITSALTLRRTLILFPAMFALSSALCGQAWDLTSMIFFRAFQGFAAGILIPTAATIIVTVLPKAQRTVGLALFGVMATFGPSIGPTLGGWLTLNYSWKYAFYINILPAILLIAINAFTLRKEPLRLDRLKSADWFGVGLLVAFLSSLTVVLEEGTRKDWFSSPLISWLTAVATITGILFIAQTLATDHPVVNLRLLKKRNFLFACVLSVGIGMALYGSIYIVPLYLSEIQNYNALQIGEVLMWVGFPQLVVLPFVPWLMTKVDTRLMITIGVAFLVQSFWMNAHLNHEYAYHQFVASQLVRAMGQPLIMTPLTTTAYEGIAHEDVPSASGLYNMLRNLGGSVGISGLSTLLTDRYRFHFERISSNVREGEPQVLDFLRTLTRGFQAHGADAHTAHAGAVQALGQLINREANVMAFGDTFLAMAVAMALTCVGVVFMKHAGHRDKDERMEMESH